MTTDEIVRQRTAVVQEAAAWIKTPFHHNAAIKGVNGGCDCSHLGMSYSVALGVQIRWPEDPSRYTSNPQWFLHADPKTGEFIEIYLEGMLANGFIEIPNGRSDWKPYRQDRWVQAERQMGDCVITRLGRLFAHGAIIEKWPEVIQAEPTPLGRGYVTRATAKANWFLTSREMRVFSWKGWH